MKMYHSFLFFIIAFAYAGKSADFVHGEGKKHRFGHFNLKKDSLAEFFTGWKKKNFEKKRKKEEKHTGKQPHNSPVESKEEE